MQNLIKNLPENITITVTKKDLIDFADYIISRIVAKHNIDSTNKYLTII